MSEQINTEDNRNIQNQTTKSGESDINQKSADEDDVQIEGGDAGKYDSTENDVAEDGNDGKEDEGPADHELPSESTESEFAHVSATQKDSDVDEEKIDKDDSGGI